MEKIMIDKEKKLVTFKCKSQAGMKAVLDTYIDGCKKQVEDAVASIDKQVKDAKASMEGLRS